MDTLYTFMPLLLLIFIMYFLLIRPQKKREKQINAMRNAIKAGDRIITIGGIYGTVVRVRDEQLVIQVGADKTKLEITRWAVSKVVTDEPAASRPVRTKKEAEPEETETDAFAKKSKPKRLEKARSEAVDEAADATAAPEGEPVEEPADAPDDPNKE